MKSSVAPVVGTVSGRSRAPRSCAGRYATICAALLLPALSACSSSSGTGPAFNLTQAQLIAAASSIFRHTVVTALSLPRLPNDADIGTPVTDACTDGGSFSTTAFILGTANPEAESANLVYELGSTWDSCVEGTGSDAIEIRTSAAASGVISDFSFQRFPNGDIEVEGFIIGRVEIETSVGLLNCRVAYQILGEEDDRADDPDLAFVVAGDVCEQGFGFDLVVAAGD